MSNVETLTGLQRRLTATIPQQQIRTEVESRLKRLGRTAKVSGFRPGKAPIKVLEQQYGDSVQQEVLGESLQRSFAEAAIANKLDVAGYPEFEIKTTDLKAPEIEFSATFEVYPQVVIGDIKGESITRVAFKLSEDDVEDTIKTLRKQRAVYKAVDRAAKNDDQLLIDFTGTLNGEPFEGGSAKDFKVLLGSGRMLADFENGIVGCMAGETKSFDMTFPADYHGKDVAGKQVTFTITVHKVEEPQLPEVDADFVRSVGVADGDVEKFKQEIRDNVSREAQRRVKVRNKESVMAVLLKVAQLEVPTSLLQGEAQRLMEQSMRDMEARGMKIPKGMKLPAEMFLERAESRVKLGLILAELVKQQNLKATPEQVEALIEEYAQSFERPDEVRSWYRAEPARMQELENLALEDNVVAWVMAGAKVTEQEVKLNELMGN
ncbi:MAG: trigger factor [Gammaproteobacteria bacterium]|nr:trigger factor [Sideroxydans sp.]MBU3903442.1 trigger factor [Gammaproteobacteria bacterium]MBU4044948.1 trigger factor [Gammaproteobacteria bacterium]MBU4150296.1 trigger factor [Gammaproteobacteria bacterium]